MGSIYTEKISSLLSFEMVKVKGGNFLMGGIDGESYRNEQPVHLVNLSAFFLGRTPVNQLLWEEIMGFNPSYFQGANRPVEMVSWNQTQIFLKGLNNLTGKLYRLPTEIEWEFSAKGGNLSEGYTYSGSDRLEEVGWYYENSGNQTQIVGEKIANEIGIYDMSGNVWEWVEDDWHNNYEGAPQDGSSRVTEHSNPSRVRRGGSWNNSPEDCRVSCRSGNAPNYYDFDIGFRLALSTP